MLKQYVFAASIRHIFELISNFVNQYNRMINQILPMNEISKCFIKHFCTRKSSPYHTTIEHFRK